MSKLPMTAIALVAIAALAACESNGHTRYASVGTVGPGGANGGSGSDGQNGSPGAQGPAGPAGPQGPSGPAGPTGPQGEPGGNFALGDTGMIATGGLVGPSGVGGTGLLANLGDPSASIPVVSDTTASGGSLVTSVGNGLNAAIDEANLPTELASVTGAVTQTVTNVGDALESFGSEGTPLVDGLTSSVSPVLAASLGGGTVAGDESASSLIGVSVLSADQQSGTLADIGIASGDTLINADLSTGSNTALEIGPLISVDLGPVTGGVNDLLASGGDVPETPLDPVLSGATGLVGGLLSGGAN